MTREEAIRCLSVHSSTNGSGLCTDEQHYKAKQMAIQALSQEPNGYVNIAKDLIDYEEDSIFYQEPCDDAISREDAINALANVPCYSGSIKSRMVGAIEGLPSVTQKSETVTEFADRCRECGARYGKLLKQKSGKWIDYSDEGFVECPICGHATNCEDNIDELHYCFYCGAKMFEPQESEE